MRVCIVCAGNICRSPIAEAVFRTRLADAGLDQAVTVSSAGTGNWHAGDPADPRALSVLRASGYDGSAHRARQFQASWFQDIDLVLALDHANFADLRRLAPDDDARKKIRMLRSYDPAAEHEGDLEVPDPYFGANDGFAHVLRLVEDAAAGFTGQMTRQLAGPDDGDQDVGRPGGTRRP